MDRRDSFGMSCRCGESEAVAGLAAGSTSALEQGLLTIAPLYRVQMNSTRRNRDDEGDVSEVLEGVTEGITDISEGRTADGEELDEALGL